MADEKPKEKPKSDDWFPIIIFVVLLAGASGLIKGGDTKQPTTQEVQGEVQTVSKIPNPINISNTPNTSNSSGVDPDTRAYTDRKYGFTFNYSTGLYVHERPNGIILLPTFQFPVVQGELYALGRYVILTRNPLIGPNGQIITRDEFIRNVSTENNIFEGKPTKVSWEKHNNLQMLRIEHRNVNAPQTLNYYVFIDGWYFNLQMYPYNGIDSSSSDYVDFMKIVNSFRLSV